MTTSEQHAEKKFRSVITTQDAIQSLSLWVVHHKAQHEKIVDVWFNVLKKSKLDHRLTLFYVCNDIVQICKRKHALVYKDAFKDVLKDATLLVRDTQIKDNVKRIYGIWRQRLVYEAAFIDELIDIIDHNKVQPAMSSKLLAEFQPLNLMEKVITLNRYENELEHKRRQLVNLRVDASSLHAVRQLKDRAHGKEFCAEFEGACSKMDDYVKCMEKEIADRNELIELLEQSELYYDSQYGEAKIVANAYKNFGARVHGLAKKLEEKIAALPRSLTPPGAVVDDVVDEEVISSSPDVTPPRVEDITSPQRKDNVESVDMDMSDDDDVMHATQTSSVNAAHDDDDDDAPYSPKSDLDDDPAPQASPIVNIQQNAAAAEVGLSVPTLAQGASHSFIGQDDVLTAMRQSAPAMTSSSGDAATGDEGGSTPVMDEDSEQAAAATATRRHEHDDDEPPMKRANADMTSSAPPPTTTKANPIDFLTSLINMKSSVSSSTTTTTSTPSSFVPEVPTNPSSLGGSGTSEGSWASWKANEAAANQYSAPPPPGFAPPQPPLPPRPAFNPAAAGFGPGRYGAPPPGAPMPFPPTPPPPSGSTSHGTLPPPPLPPQATPPFPTPPRPFPPPQNALPPFRPPMSQSQSAPVNYDSGQNNPFMMRGPRSAGITGDFRPPFPRGPGAPASSPTFPPGANFSRFPHPHPPRLGAETGFFPPGGNSYQPPTSSPGSGMGSNSASPPVTGPQHGSDGFRAPPPGGFPPRPPPPSTMASTWPQTAPSPRQYDNQPQQYDNQPQQYDNQPQQYDNQPRQYDNHNNHNFNNTQQNKTNLTTIKTVEVESVENSMNDVMTSSSADDVTAHDDHSNNDAMSHETFMSSQALPEAAMDTTSSPAVGDSNGAGEGQQEFINKLRRKTNFVGATGPTQAFERQSSSNLRTLTEVSVSRSGGGGGSDVAAGHDVMSTSESAAGDTLSSGDGGDGDSGDANSFMPHVTRRASNDDGGGHGGGGGGGVKPLLPPPWSRSPHRQPRPPPSFHPRFRSRADFNSRPSFRLDGGQPRYGRFPGPRPPRPPIYGRPF